MEAAGLSIADQFTKYRGSPWTFLSLGIDELLKLTSAVRKSTTKTHGLSVPAHFETSDDEAFGNYARLIVRYRFPSARTSLTNQIGDALSSRRRYLLYRQSHERKLRGIIPPQARYSSSLANQHSELVLSSDTTRPQDGAPILSPAGRQNLTPSVILRTQAGETEISKPRRSAFFKHRNMPSNASGSVSGRSKQRESNPALQYPKIPPIVDDKRSCYYCLRRLPENLTEVQWQ